MHAITPEFTVFNTKNKFDWIYLFSKIFGFFCFPLASVNYASNITSLFDKNVCSEYIQKDLIDCVFLSKLPFTFI